MDMKRYYLAYGSNLNMKQMKLRCPGARVMGTAYIHGYGLFFKGSKTGAYLTVEPRENGIVPVAVWEVTERDELALDRYEGFPAFYYKAELPIRYTGICTKKEREAEAFIYIMHEEREIGMPSRFYVQTCAEGYRDFGFDETYLAEAIEISRKAVS